ncbi:monovalent cation/H+ antiporter subunit D [Acinetobacter boissieri]|uniref:Multisubunit potassium/proton antiporter, PhaD subunit n=1 Tax=Acinetobacter boissieri TaxID=1219383 RepID=A0A1G6GIB2_9GAMM|nr:monovalent cation/H+ antiporter subunit D [Acinetobacter boissieri]SDB81485.1 multisubunit potassium/proton antiporter, PhaD subunit [Acinetobacter boissieri]
MNSFFHFWHAQTPIISILIPAFAGFILLLLGNPRAEDLLNDKYQPWRRFISYTATIAGFVTALSYVIQSTHGQLFVYSLSQWSAPFGIVLVLDRLSGFMLLLTYLLALPILWFASSDWDLRGRYFHALLQFLLMGLCGAFLTGDLFNLFVFFEVLLMSSYVLLIYGQGKARFQLGIHYVVINLVASAIFLVSLGLIYASVGSLNMADVARIMPTLHPDQKQLATAGAYLLFTVFAIKAAVLPLGFWLPKTYAVASTPVAALFTLMTKVGIYAILRVNSVLFIEQEYTALFNILLALGLIGSLYGVIGALGAIRLRRFVGFMILSSLGTICVALGIDRPASWTAGLYYLFHSTIVGAAFYLLCGWITAQRGEFKDHFKVAPRMKQNTLLSICFFLIALMMAGLPPFSGFLGKVFILQSTAGYPYQVPIMITILVVSLLSILAFVKAGFVLFWQASEPDKNPANEAYVQYQALPERAPKRYDITVYFFLIMLILYVVFASPIQQYLAAASTDLSQQSFYQNAILKQDARGNVISTQPFDSKYIAETKYAGENLDPNAHLIPYIIAPQTLNGEHISQYKREQITKQQQELLRPTTLPVNNDGAKLQRMEP